MNINNKTIQLVPDRTLCSSYKVAGTVCKEKEIILMFKVRRNDNLE